MAKRFVNNDKYRLNDIDLDQGTIFNNSDNLDSIRKKNKKLYTFLQLASILVINHKRKKLFKIFFTK